MTQKYLCVVTITLLGSAVRAEDAWTQFRGPGNRGVSNNNALPLKWSATENVEWKTNLPGRGWSSPIVSGGKVLVTTVVNLGESEEPKKGLYFGGNRPRPDSVHVWKVMCLELASGDVVWEKVVHQGKPESAIHLKNSFASETPVTDGKHAYVYFGNVGVFCFDWSGALVWEKRLKPNATRYGWGTAASPVLHQDRLYIVNDNEEDSYLLALNKMTGDEIWRVARDEKSNWATPYVWQNEERTEIVTPGTGKVRSYDLEGKLLWWFEGMSSITIATPYEYGGMLFITSGYILDPKKPVYAVRPGAEGDVTLKADDQSNQWIAWRQPQAAPYNPSTLIYKDRLYVLYDRGFFACFDPRTGNPIYTRQRLRGGRAFTSSPWAYRGKVFCLNEDGQTFVVAAGNNFEVLGVNSLADDDMCMATPALAGNRLLIRTAARLYCIKGSRDEGRGRKEISR